MRVAVKFAACVLLVSSLPANAQGLKEKFLNNLGAMIVMQGRCPAWKIDAKKVAEVLNFFKVSNADVEPDGRYWPLIEKSIMENKKASEGLAPDMQCFMTELMFGHEGKVSPGFMVKK